MTARTQTAKYRMGRKNSTLVLHAGYGGEWWIWRTALDGSILDVIGPYRTKDRAEAARIYLIANPGAPQHHLV